MLRLPLCSVRSRYRSRNFLSRHWHLCSFSFHPKKHPPLQKYNCHVSNETTKWIKYGKICKSVPLTLLFGFKVVLKLKLTVTSLGLASAIHSRMMFPSSSLCSITHSGESEISKIILHWFFNLYYLILYYIALWWLMYNIWFLPFGHYDTKLFHCI